jgi:transcriptional regulator with XRE-family HTH domain
MKTFGNTIKLLLMDRGMTAKELASRINLSETSMSLIVKGVTKPRQANLTRIIEELCESPEEQQQLISAYARVQDAVSDEEGQVDQVVYDRAEENRVHQYLQAKSQSIAFRESVAAALTAAGITFQGPHQNQDIICDFFIPGSPSIAIECKSNPTRDWDRTATTVKLVTRNLEIDTALVLIPDTIKLPLADEERVHKSGGHVVKLSDLERKINLLRKSKGKYE